MTLISNLIKTSLEFSCLFVSFNINAMISNMRYLVVLLLIPTLTVASQLYKTVDKNGNVVYTDVPPDKEKAVRVDIPPGNIMPSLKVPEFKLKQPNHNRTRYKLLKITSPENESTVFINTTNIDVKVKLLPAVQTEEGHNLQILMDGKVISEGDRTNMLVDEANRGTHSISARVVDNKGKVLISAKPVSIHIRRPSRLTKGR